MNESLPLAKLIADFWVVIGLKIGNQFCQGGVNEKMPILRLLFFLPTLEGRED